MPKTAGFSTTSTFMRHLVRAVAPRYRPSARGKRRHSVSRRRTPVFCVYHCAVPPVAMHIANGMYGMILVEPEGGLPAVDREFYVMQGEIYTEEPIGTSGVLTESWQKLIDERVERGLAGYLLVEGEENPEIFTSLDEAPE